MTLHDDTTSKDALIAHLERELKEARISLRDQFAMQAMNGLLAQSMGTALGSDPKSAAEYAYAMADAMMEARKK